MGGELVRSEHLAEGGMICRRAVIYATLSLDR